MNRSLLRNLDEGRENFGGELSSPAAELAKAAGTTASNNPNLEPQAGSGIGSSDIISRMIACESSVKTALEHLSKFDALVASFEARAGRQDKDLSNRFDALEAADTGTAKTVANLHAVVDGMQTGFASLENKVGTFGADIASLAGKLETHGGILTTQAETIKMQQGIIEHQNQLLLGHERTISDLRSEHEVLKSAVVQLCRHSEPGLVDSLTKTAPPAPPNPAPPTQPGSAAKPD